MRVAFAGKGGSGLRIRWSPQIRPRYAGQTRRPPVIAGWPGAPHPGRLIMEIGGASGSVNRLPGFRCARHSTRQHLRKRPVSWVFPVSWAIFLVSRCGS